MNLDEFITPNRVIAEMHSHDRDTAIRELLNRLVEDRAIPLAIREDAFELFLIREDERSTGIGRGIAIPHCFLSGIDQVVGVFGRSSEGIDFDSIDLGLVHYIVLFIVPEVEHSLHLQVLSEIARCLSQPEIPQRLSSAVDDGDLFQVLTEASRLVEAAVE